MDVLYREGIVLEDDLVFAETMEGRSLVKVSLRCERMVCASSVLVRVLKWMNARRGDKGPEVMSTFYQYQAWRRSGRGRKAVQQLLRYDQAHGGTPHAHRYTPSGLEISEPVTLDEIPRLDGFIREAVALAEPSN